ncbi:MAG: hypothetical protein V1890_05085 [Candidatus Zixiibacteriota bacterium]
MSSEDSGRKESIKKFEDLEVWRKAQLKIPCRRGELLKEFE